jgi:hypothetical protein
MNMRTFIETPPAIFTRELVQQLSHVAALADRAVVLGDAPTGERARRQREIEREARQELRQLRNVLDGLPLE